jgi:hypothetical protein
LQAHLPEDAVLFLDERERRVELRERALVQYDESVIVDNLRDMSTTPML